MYTDGLEVLGPLSYQIKYIYIYNHFQKPN